MPTGDLRAYNESRRSAPKVSNYGSEGYTDSYPIDFDDPAYVPTWVLLMQKQRQDKLAKKSRRQDRKAYKHRGEGLRVQLSAIPGVTQGKAKKILRTPYRFQCPPLDEFKHPTTRNLTRWTNYQGIEFSGRGGMALKELTFRTLVVEWGSFVTMYDYNIEPLVNELKGLVKAGYPFELLATHRYGEDPEVHMDAFLTDVQVTENAGEVDARYLDLTFVAFRDPTAKRRKIKEWPKYLEIFKEGGKTRYRTVDWDIPAKARRKLEAKDLTFAHIAKYAYGYPQFADHIMSAQKPRIHGEKEGMTRFGTFGDAKKPKGQPKPIFASWGKHTPIIKHPRYKKLLAKKRTVKILIPEPPEIHGQFGENTPRGIFLQPGMILDEHHRRGSIDSVED